MCPSVCVGCGGVSWAGGRVIEASGPAPRLSPTSRLASALEASSSSFSTAYQNGYHLFRCPLFRVSFSSRFSIVVSLLYSYMPARVHSHLDLISYLSSFVYGRLIVSHL
jgi:hypothetical protein